MWTVDYLLQRLRSYNEETAILVGPDTGISYKQLLACATHNIQVLENALSLSDVQPHASVIAIDLTMSWRAVPVILAALQLRMTMLLVDKERDSQNASSHIDREFPHAIHIQASNVNMEGYIQQPPDVPRVPAAVPRLEDVAVIVQTSGTSGRPKSVMLTYSNILSNAADIAETLQLERSERILIQRPLSYISAFTGELLAGLLSGCSVLLKPLGRTPLSLIPLIQGHAITTIGATPALLAMLAPQARKNNLSSLHRIILSGERLTDTQLQLIQEAFPQAAIWNAYGLSEASPRISCLKLSSGRFPAACVGYPLPHVHTMIVDGDGAEMPEGAVGQLIVSGPNIMKGYYNDEPLTRCKVKNGWLFTGDMAFIEQGRITIAGRADHMMIRAGNNIYPEEIESLLMSHPHICEAMVFSLPHPIRGEQIHAWVTCSQTIAVTDIHRFIMQSGAHARLWPDIVEIHPDLPKTASGKLLRLKPDGSNPSH
ncbi:class I adenylate-forming enzyme family protein [Paenibacillus sambharensis]|nr:class I adenylate-forming enzyme family protein [Paenibacillus sambharensis]